MYCQEKIDERLEHAREELGFLPEYHTRGDIAEFNRQLERRFADEYQAARILSAGADDRAKMFQMSLMRSLNDTKRPQLSKDDIRFMMNETALIQCDAAYFLTRYYRIKSTENIVINFDFEGKAAQKILFEVIAEMERLGIAIELLIAKARQLGMTTIIQGLIFLKAMMTYGASGVVASADKAKTGEMVQKMLMGYDELPWWIRPLTSRRVESQNGMIMWGAMNSGISFQHGTQVNPIAMGSTPICYHLSEVSSYFDAAYDLIEVGLFKAVHPSPRVLGFLESTCKGNTGYWSSSYWNAKDHWKTGESRVMALFLPFYCDKGMYPNETERMKNPVPVDWKPDQDTRLMMAESELYVQSNPVLDKVLRRESGESGPWRMPREKAHYWELKFKEATRKGKPKDWYQEMPHTDRHAFQGSYDNVFGREIIAEVWSERMPYKVYGIVGQSIEERHEPDAEEVDYRPGAVRIPVQYKSRKNGEVYRWELIPLLWEEPFEGIDSQELIDNEAHMGKLFVWLEPEKGYDYSIGVDTSNGVGQDASCIAVSRRGRGPQDRDVQVAEFRDNNVSHVEAWAWVLAIAAYYSRYMTPEHRSLKTEPYVSIEQIESVGDTCQDQMSLCGYSRFHKMIHYDKMPKHMKKSRASRRGWFTAGWSRPMLTDGFVITVQNGWYKVNSPYTLWEMDHWEVHYPKTGMGKGKFEHGEESTDDGIFANALASFCPNDRKMQAERSEKQWRGGDKTAPVICIDAPKTGLLFPEPVSYPERRGFRKRR